MIQIYGPNYNHESALLLFYCSIVTPMIQSSAL